MLHITHTTCTTHSPLRTHRTLLLLIIVGALLIRLPWLTAPDPVGDLELAARRMGFLHAEGLAGSYLYHGDYMPLRLYLLYGLSQLVEPLGGGFHAPLPPVTLILVKIPALFADLATAVLIFTWSVRWQSPRRSAVIAMLYAASPPIWINVAWWGQVDALLMLPLVGMVTTLDRAHGRWGWLWWAVALAIKPQAIVFAPLLYAATLRLHGTRGLVEGSAIAIGSMILFCTPLVVAGEGPGLMQAYFGSVGRFPKLTIGAYNLWHLMTWGHGGNDDALLWGSISYRAVGMMMVGGVAAAVMIALLRQATPVRRAMAGAGLGLGFFLFPTQIHERYLFLSLAFVALLIAYNPRFVLLYLLLITTATVNIFATLDGFLPHVTPLLAHPALSLGCALLNIAAVVVLMGRMWGEEGVV
jgi:hypothetical protein